MCQGNFLAEVRGEEIWYNRQCEPEEELEKGSGTCTGESTE